MEKCARCSSLFVFRKKIQLSDAIICKQCFRELGFDESHDHFSEAYSYDEIKDGREAMIERREVKRPPSLADLSEEEKELLIQGLMQYAPSVEHGGKEKGLDCEPEESEMFAILRSMYEDLGKNPEDIKLVRYSDNYVTAKLGESDLARIHWGPRAKWIVFPSTERHTNRHNVKAPEDVRNFEDLLKDSVENIEEW